MLNLLMYYFCHTSHCSLLADNPSLWRHLPQVGVPVAVPVAREDSGLAWRTWAPPLPPALWLTSSYPLENSLDLPCPCDHTCSIYFTEEWGGGHEIMDVKVLRKTGSALNL